MQIENYVFIIYTHIFISFFHNMTMQIKIDYLHLHIKRNYAHGSQPFYIPLQEGKLGKDNNNMPYHISSPPPICYGVGEKIQYLRGLR